MALSDGKHVEAFVAGVPMSFMFEIFYNLHRCGEGKQLVTREVTAAGGQKLITEKSQQGAPGGLTFEFDEMDCAQRAAAKLREQGEYIEGPVDYGA